MTAERPPAPPNGCQKYHGVPGCRCQVRASKDQPHPGAHHCDEHDRYWTDREEMYVEMYLSVASKWAALLEHADLAEDVQPEEVIDALSVRCNRRAEDHEPPAPAEGLTPRQDAALSAVMPEVVKAIASAVSSGTWKPKPIAEAVLSVVTRAPPTRPSVRSAATSPTANRAAATGTSAPPSRRRPINSRR